MVMSSFQAALACDDFDFHRTIDPLLINSAMVALHGFTHVHLTHSGNALIDPVDNLII